MVAFSPDWGVDKTDEETLRAHSRSHTTVATAEIFAEKEHMMRRLRNKLGRKRAEAHETQATNDRSGNNLLLSVTGMQSQSLPQRAAASPILGTPATTPKSPKPSSPPPQPPRPQQGSGQPKLAHLGPGGTKKDYWKMAAEKLQEEDPSFKDAIAGLERAATTAGDNDFAMQLQAATERSRKELESRKWRFNVGSKEIIPREHFDGLIKTVAAIKDLASAAAGVDPIHAGLPLAGFLVLMQMATNDFDQYASMAAGVEEVMTIMARYRLIEESHGQRLQDGLKQEFDKQLINLYKHIIRYQISATTYYRRNTMARYIRAMPKLDDLKEVTLAVRQQDDACWKIVDILYSAGIDLRLDQLEQRLTAPNVLATPSANMHWIVPRSTNSLFTGRNAILDELKVIIQNAVNEPTPDQQCRIVVTGIGGQGKSKLCLQLANRCRALFWGVFWIDVGSTSLAEQAFISLAQQLQISAQTWEEACQALGALQDRWLLVLDNADDRCVNYQRYFPASTLGVVLLTSRNDQFHCYATNKHVPLGGLGDKEARELLLRAAGVAADKHQDRDAQTQQDFDRDADRVATLLYSHPLALIQAAAYVARGHCPLAAYPQVYEKQRKRLLQFHPEQAQSRYSDVYTTFEASVSILQSVDAEACRDALSLLPVLAVFERNRLPIFLFEEAWRGAQAVKADPRDVEPDMEHLHTWHLDRLPPWMQMNEQAWDSFRLIQALSELRALSLVMTDTQEGYMSISMHPLVHAWARDRESEAEQHLSSVVAGCLVALSADYSIWAQYSHLLQAHLEAVVSLELNQLFRSEPLVMINGIIFRCGYLLRNMRADDQLSALLTRWFGYHNWSLTKVEQTALGAYRLAADDSLHQGYYPQAITLLKQRLTLIDWHASVD
ncbi:uncharacterized protein HMPREF1541_06583 [Cyphellophora europaea CBS 101466]|uniref:NWD NACHT-NTPase N-terminal domain-containing protein n=1 Tax=Cyphellophora europaea (strain CBS 101466) TaxID=1220924 RepID=W2RPZ9_CYPE1|nr:uncharacterized protein HMPREF1541_06583 [Cyphellophora europaea CBS 101466]ETN38547.1 hypothetical protein HMPREF1541_06583 [Cyphellophora europaea CBS 101466]